jgi:hypothetical protein
MKLKFNSELRSVQASNSENFKLKVTLDILIFKNYRKAKLKLD